jgi:hypothetical protein
MGFGIAGVIGTVAVLYYIRWQKRRDRARHPGMWRK